METRLYRPSDEAGLYVLIRAEGDEWHDYWGQWAAYLSAIERSAVMVAVDGDPIAGYARCIEDPGFGLHIVDLLVGPRWRGRALGRALMESAAALFPGVPAYVHSGVDEYYLKQGYKRVGSLFAVQLERDGGLDDG